MTVSHRWPPRYSK